MRERSAQGGHGDGRDDRDRGHGAENGQRYESYLVRLLLDDDGSIRATRMEHIGTGEVKRWAGWKQEAMYGFIQATARTQGSPLPAAPAAPGLLAAPVGPQDAQPYREQAPEPASPAAADAPASGPVPPVLALRSECAVVRAGQPFTLTLRLELSEEAQRGQRLAYSAVIVARPLEGGARSTLATAEGLLPAADTATITIAAAGPSPGTYLLEGAASLRPAGASHGGVAAMAEGILLRVLQP